MDFGCASPAHPRTRKSGLTKKWNISSVEVKRSAAPKKVVKLPFTTAAPIMSSEPCARSSFDPSGCRVNSR